MLDVKEDVETLEDWVEVEQCNENDIVLVFAYGGSVAVFGARAFYIIFLRDLAVHPKFLSNAGQFGEKNRYNFGQL